MVNKHFGFWVFGRDMTAIDLKNLQQNGITDIFLNYYAFAVYGQSKVLSWIKKANENKIDVHIWVQCFYDGEWHNPVSMDFKPKLKEIKKYANMEGVKGIFLDYLRYPGTAHKTTGSADAITNFVKQVKQENPKTFLSCAVMPENSCKKYYGQDIPALGKIVNVVIPMQYKGNYKAGTDWLASITKSFSQQATIWSGLQSYKSDSDVTPLSSTELLNDSKTCLNNGATGIVLFRYGLSPKIDFNTLLIKKTIVKKDVIAKIAKEVKQTVEKEKKIPAKSNGYTFGEYTYLLAKSIVSPNKDYEKKSVVKASNPNGTIISQKKVMKTDYIDLAKRMIKFVDENKQLPNYISYKNDKIKTEVYIDAFARIVNYYYVNKAMPNYVTVNSKNIK